MTVVRCDCGGAVDTAKTLYCESCRYSLNEQRVKYDDSWCWEWWGPANHRMKCRRSKGHSGGHPDSENSNHLTVSMQGEMLAEPRKHEGLKP